MHSLSIHQGAHIAHRSLWSCNLLSLWKQCLEDCWTCCKCRGADQCLWSREWGCQYSIRWNFCCYRSPRGLSMTLCHCRISYRSLMSSTRRNFLLMQEESQPCFLRIWTMYSHLLQAAKHCHQVGRRWPHTSKLQRSLCHRRSSKFLNLDQDQLCLHS